MSADSHNSANKDRHTREGAIARWHLRSFNEAIYRLIAKSEPKTVLDAGCGEGFVLDYIASSNPDLKLDGIDMCSNAIAYAKKHFGHAANFSVGSILNLPYEDNSFDTVVCSEVLEHIEDWSSAINELKRVSRRYVVITVPHEPLFKFLNDIGRAIRFCQDPGHVNFWRWQQFKEMVRARFPGALFERKHLIYQLALARL